MAISGKSSAGWHPVIDKAEPAITALHSHNALRYKPCTTLQALHYKPCNTRPAIQALQYKPLNPSLVVQALQCKPYATSPALQPLHCATSPALQALHYKPCTLTVHCTALHSKPCTKLVLIHHSHIAVSHSRIGRGQCYLCTALQELLFTMHKSLQQFTKFFELCIAL